MTGPVVVRHARRGSLSQSMPLFRMTKADIAGQRKKGRRHHVPPPPGMARLRSVETAIPYVGQEEEEADESGDGDDEGPGEQGSKEPVVVPEVHVEEDHDGELHR